MTSFAFASVFENAQAAYESAVSAENQAYISQVPSDQQRDIFDAQDEWETTLKNEQMPSAKTLNEYLDVLRKAGYRGDTMIEKLVFCMNIVKGFNNYESTHIRILRTLHFHFTPPHEP